MDKTIYRFAWISIGAAVITILMKMTAWWVTGSVGFLSDALESIVNLVGSVVALAALIVATREPDEEHTYGHAKAEYFSSGLEGALIIIAAIAIIATAINRLLHPQGLSSPLLGVVISIAAAIVNYIAARLLQSAARHHRSIALEADASHLLADVVTTVGVIVGVILIELTGWNRLDPVIALLVGANIIRVGYTLINRSIHGLMDTALPLDEIARIENVLQRFHESDGIEAHALRTRQAGQRRFGSVHILVPGSWTVDRGHQLTEEIEKEIQAGVPGIMMVTHLESLDDPHSFEDSELPATFHVGTHP